MISKSLADIKLPDINNLLNNVRESKTIEYKQVMPAGTEKEIVQFLAAVSAFANTAGGDLLIGISSNDGIATAAPGIPLAGFDGEKLRLEQLLADNIEPRMPPVAFHSVPCGNGNHVVIVRVRQSWLAPHRVAKNDKFYGRNSAGKYSLDVGELRNAFSLRENVAQRMQEFRRKRLFKIMNGETPSQLEPSTSMVLHVIPFPSFGDRQIIDIVGELEARPITMPVPLGSRGTNSGVNLDGLFIYSGPSLDKSHGYGLLFRDASIEGVKQLSVKDGVPYIAGGIFENDVVSTLKLYLQTCTQLDAGFPIYVGLSFCNAKGCTLNHDGGGFWTSNGLALPEDVIVLPECIIESEASDITKVLKPIFDMVWNAFGYARSDKYNQKGDWIGVA